jgi:hypothetical protein
LELKMHEIQGIISAGAEMALKTKRMPATSNYIAV